MDRPFESDGEAPPPQDDAVASVASSNDSSHGNTFDASQTHYHQHPHLHQRHQHQQHHHHQQHEPESLSIFMRGLRDLAARHKAGGGGASQRIVVSRLNAAAIAVQVLVSSCDAQIVARFADAFYNSVPGVRACLDMLPFAC